MTSSKFVMKTYNFDSKSHLKSTIIHKRIRNFSLCSPMKRLLCRKNAGVQEYYLQKFYTKTSNCTITGKCFAQQIENIKVLRYPEMFS